MLSNYISTWTTSTIHLEYGVCDMFLFFITGKQTESFWLKQNKDSAEFIYIETEIQFLINDLYINCFCVCSLSFYSMDYVAIPLIHNTFNIKAFINYENDVNFVVNYILYSCFSFITEFWIQNYCKIDGKAVWNSVFDLRIYL